MANAFYTPSGNPGTTAPGASSPIRSEFQAISAAFDKMPVFSGNNNLLVCVNPSATALTVVPGLLFTMNAFNVTFTANANVNVQVPSSSGTLALLSDVTAGLAATVPPGIMTDYGGATAPAGWLMCNGQLVSRSTYTALFNVLNAAGLPYGAGDGSTTFGLPDLRGRVTAGLDNMGGTTTQNRINTAIASTTLGAVGGGQQVTLDATMLPAHAHGYSDPGHGHGYSDGGHVHGFSDPWHQHYFGSANAGCGCTGGGSVFLAADNYTNLAPTGGSVANGGVGITISGNTSNITISNTGGGLAHSNVQNTMVINKIIKT